MSDTMKDLDNYPDRIADSFIGKTVLLTGGSGFVGKVFVEKLLRVSPNVRKVFVLIRSKKNKDPNERMREIFNGPLYDVLRKQHGDEIFRKVEAIPADMEAADLGLSLENRQKLSDEVEMIYHCAATIRFDEPLKKAVLLNVRGTKLMLDLAKECKKLTIFLHLSTAYCHLQEKVLYEKLYAPPADPHKVIETCEWLSEDTLDKITDKLLGDFPNTYAYSKALSEGLISEQMDTLPVGIVRPSIVVPIWKEPLPGWTDNLNGPVGILIAAGKGVLRTMHCRRDTYSDYIPVDVLANCLISAPLVFFQTNKRVSNLTSSSQYKILFEEIIEIGKRIINTKVPLNGVVWYPGGSINPWRWRHNLDFFLFQYLPAIFLDGLLVILGYKPVLMRVQKRIMKGYEVLEYYTNNQWDFNNDETLQLRDTLLNPRERETYKMDGNDMDYEEYFTTCTRAARLYLLKEDDSTIPAAKRHMAVMWAVDRICRTLFFMGVLYIVYKYLFVLVFQA